MNDKPAEKQSPRPDIVAGIFATLGILIKWGGGWWVAYQVLPAFAGVSSELVVNSVVTWSVNKGAPNFIFPVAFFFAVVWAMFERRHRIRDITRLTAEMKLLEGGPPIRLETAGKSVGTEQH